MKTAKSQLFNLKSMQEQIAAAPNEKPSSEPIKPNPDLLDELDTSLIEDSQPKEEITSTTETIEDSEPKEDLASATEAMEEAKEAMEDAKESMEEAKTELEETKETMADIEKSVPTSDNNKSPAIALDIKPEAVVESKDTSNKNNIEKLDAETEKLLEEAKKIEAMTSVVNKENTELNKQKEEQKIFTPTPETVSPSPQSENLGNISSVTK